MSEWQSIATAPKDGRTILAFGPYNSEIITVRWKNKGEWCAVYDGNSVIQYQGDFGTNYIEYEQPTHWHPLPPPPSSEEQKMTKTWIERATDEEIVEKFIRATESRNVSTAGYRSQVRSMRKRLYKILDDGLLLSTGKVRLKEQT